MMPKIGLFPGEDIILDRLNKITNWEDTYTFMKCLNAGNALISIMPTDGYDRWKLHQQWNREMHETYASKTDQDIVVGFFQQGEAEEISLFETYLFKEEYLPKSPLVIGRGLEGMSYYTYANWDTSESREFDGCFSMGGEEKYDAETRLYTRKSMSGRHDYVLKVKQDNEVVVVEAGGKTWN